MNAQYKDEFIDHYEMRSIRDIIYKKRGDSYIEYRKLYEEISSKQLYNAYPMYIVLAINSYCNLRCKMCMRNFEDYNSERIDLPIDIIKKIVRECEEIGTPSIFIGSTAEALLRKDIREVLRIVGEGRLLENFLITNGTMLTRDIAELLIKLQYERLYVSLDAATESTYKAIRGADLNKVESNIEQFLKLREEMESELPVMRVSFVKQEQNKDEIDVFFEKWKDKVDIIDFQNKIDYSGWNDLKCVEELEPIDFKCVAPFRMLYIDYLGDIYPCSSDYCYHMKIGNINTMTIKEAWDSKLMNDLRDNIRNKHLDRICLNCAHYTDGSM